MPSIPSGDVAQIENVLVVPTELFRELGYFQGFSPHVQRYLQPLLESPSVSYRPRNEMEDDPTFKQLIPYVVFRHAPAVGEAAYFQYTRGTGQGERRLHAKMSLGVGGHISSSDAACGGGSAYREGMQRELAEEVAIGAEYRQRCVGLINDDETAVGRVHLGVVHLVDVEEPLVRANEEEIIDAGFRSMTDIRGQLDKFESWSQIVIQAVLAGEIV